jgi:hypothetical protein
MQGHRESIRRRRLGINAPKAKLKTADGVWQSRSGLPHCGDRSAAVQVNRDKANQINALTGYDAILT